MQGKNKKRDSLFFASTIIFVVVFFVSIYLSLSTAMSTADPLSSRPVGGTENSWCKAVPGGTGITVLALLLSKPPHLPILQTALHNLQISNPILRSKLHLDLTSQTFSFVIPESPSLEVKSFDLTSTLEILRGESRSLSSFQTILEHEINSNPWENVSELSPDGSDVFQAKLYELEGGKWIVALKSHTAACDRAAAVAVLRELLVLVMRGCGGGEEFEIDGNGELMRGIEEYIPIGKGSKPFWARGIDMLGYSLNSFRLSNIDFVDSDSPRRSQLVRLRLDPEATTKLLEGCKTREIKLCGALSAAGLMAARLCRGTLDGQWEKFSVVTLTDCRTMLEPALTTHGAGFYHSAILNSHDLNGSEQLWDLAKRTYNSFRDAKNANKHFTDMADLNFLMCKAIENPGLTPSSSMRTSFISVFEDVVVDVTGEAYEKMGVEDYIGCASVHGVGPTVALFDTIRDGRLDCACMYPAPLHSREQMEELIGHMKSILEDASSDS